MSNRIRRNRVRSLEALEDRRFLAGDPIISEFLAVNNASIRDADGEFSDWIEIHNPREVPHNLDGWYLSDNAAELEKWRFPPVEIGPRGYLVVFASNKNRKDPAAELHTNFRLDGAGEFLALVQPDGLTATSIFNPFPIQLADVAYGLGATAESTTLIGPQAAASVHVPNATTGPLLDQIWTAADYAVGSNGETWTGAQTGVGYDVDNQYDPLFGAGGDVETLMHNVNSGAYVRIPFAVDDPGQLDRMTLRMRYDDGFTAYLNGEEIVTRNVGSVAVQPQNMIAFYRFDEAAGLTAAESTGRAAHGNLVNFPGDNSQWTTGRIGRALEFRGAGSADHVLVPSYSKPTTSMSASAWVWADSRPTWASIIKNWGNATAGQFHFGLNAGDGRLSNHLDASSAVAIEPTLFPTGSWEHVAFVADAAAGQMTIYHNGVAVVSTAYDGVMLNSVMNSIGIGVKTNDAGTAPDTGAPGYWDGKLDEIALWNTAIAPAEVLAIYTGGLQGVGLATAGAGGGQASWNAAATADRPDALATQFETFDLTGVRGLLNPGTNLLAIHAVNVTAGDADFLIAPEITAETATIDLERRQYITLPTPGTANSTGVATLGPIISQVAHSDLPPEVITTPLVGILSPLAAYAPTSAALGDEWFQPQYVLGTHGESWTSGAGGIGFDDDGAFAGLIGTDLGGSMPGVNSSAFIRSSFTLADPAIAERLKLRMSYDDGFVAYLNGVEVARANAPVSPVRGGLVAYYDFDDNTSDRANLYANNIGTAVDDLTPQVGTIHYVAGKRGQAVALNVDLDGVAPDDIRRLDAPRSSDVQMPATYSIEAWINPTALNGTGRIVANFALNFQYRLELQSDNRLALVHRQSSGTIVTALSPVGAVVVGQWQHVAGVADGTLLRAYVNGVEVAQLPYNGTVTNANEPLGVGDRPGRNDGVAQQYEGYLDELALWEVPLTGAEVLAHFQADSAGYGLTPNPAPGLSFRAAATGERPDSQSAIPQEFDLTAVRNLLVSGENVLAIHGLNLSAANGDFLIRPELVAESGHPTQGQTLVTAVVHDALAPVQSVELRYRVMYGAEQTLPMLDDGLHGDGDVGDGIYGAKIPGSAAAPGQMLRWYVTASDQAASASRNPLFLSATESPEYYGTVIPDPAITTPLPVLHWFVANPALAETGTGTRASVFYDGEFYDNVFVRIRGETARSWPKKSYKFDFHRGHHFRYREDVPRVEEFNLNTTYTDKSYIRQLLSYEAFRDAGVPYSESFPLHVRQNDAFYSVAHFVEQPDEEYLARNGLNDEGALYKISYVGNNFGLSSTGGAEKRNRREEDFSDLQALVAGLAQTGPALHNYLFDHVNLAEVINYMAANVVIQNIDRTVKNFYVYRDTTGTGQWQMFPWDVDLAFGPNALNTDVIEATDDSPNQHTSHPFFGGTQFPYTGLMNRLLDAVYRNPVTRQMYLRRLRSLMDQLLNAPGTPPAERYFESRIDELVTLLSADVTADRAKWGASAHFGGTTYTLQQAADRIKNEYLAPRRTHLFQTHAATSQAGIPGAQLGNPVIEFAAIEFAPASGNPDEEFIQLFNPHPFAVDVTGWKLTGGVEHDFTAGTVIPAGQSLYVVPDAMAFRARATGPGGGQGLLIQGNYQGHLSNFGETIDLVAADESVVATTTTPSVPSPAQRYLRMTEVMYHPAAPQPNEIALGFTDRDDFEYLELLNISDTTTPTTLDLTGIRFSQGLSFSFTTASTTSLAPGERILIGRSAAALAARYGAGLPVVGEFAAGEGLANGGEPLKLEDADGGTIHEFDYEDDWYPLTDGSGHSLVIVSSLQPLDAWDGKNGWRESFSAGGSPGVPDLMPGDANGDERVDRLDLAALQAHLGSAGGATRQQGDFNGDGAVNRLDAVILLRSFGRSFTPLPPPPAPAASIEASVVSPNRTPKMLRSITSRSVDLLMADLGDDSPITLRATSRRVRLRPSNPEWTTAGV